jgi:hypothetical protein
VDTYQNEAEKFLGHVDLCVLNPEGTFFSRGVHLDDQATPRGGTWHWPERV